MLEQGEILRDRYKVIRRLGQGGMGAVYEAHDNVFDTSVALKEVTIDLSNALDTQAQEMTKLAFEREAKILAKISHETIPHVKDYFIEKDAQFLIMELVDGDDLAKLLRQRNAPFPIGTIIEWTDQLLDALDYLHHQDPPIIHRDIKPQNLKLTTRKKIKLLDFGIAKGTESKSSNTITNQTFIAATLNYSPIEQMVRVLDPTFLAVITHKYTDQIETILEQNADFRTDIFALGATIYHLATNKQPAEAVKRGIEIWDGNPDPLENPSKINPEIPEEFSDFLLKSMQINRNHRYGSALEMRSALEQISEVITKPTLNPTVEMKMSDLQFQETQADFTPPHTEKEASIPRPTGNTPSAGNTSPPPTTPISNLSAEIETEVANAKPEIQQQQIPIQKEQTNPPQNFSSAHSQPQPQKKKGNKLLWLIPIAGLILVMFVGGVLGVWLVVRNMGDPDPVTDANTDTNNINTNSNSDQPEKTDLTIGGNTNSDTTNSDVEPTPESSPANDPTPELTTSKNTPAPTQKATPRKTPVAVKTPPKTPRKTPPKTPRPVKTPKQVNDCIFTDTCE
jgi:serine/threonine protein kinase